MNHQTMTVVQSSILTEVEYEIARMSFGRRLELSKRIREATKQLEFLDAGGVLEKMEAAALSLEIDRIYLNWGLNDVRGIEIDGSRASVQTFIASGPELLVGEALAHIKRECGLSEEERKN